MSETTFDAIIVGAGPGGYVAAIRASQLGLKTAIIEKRGRLGGTCLNVGCIPSKALLHSSELYHTATHSFAAHGLKVGGIELDVPAMIGRKDKVVDELTRGIAGLMKKNKVTVFDGAGTLTGGLGVKVALNVGGEVALTATKGICIATGSAEIELPFAKFDGKNIVSSTGALEFQEVPSHLVVVGGGYIGLELGSVWRRLGSQVTVIEAMDRCVPFMDDDLGSGLVKSLQKLGLDIRTNTKVLGIETGGAKPVVKVQSPDGKTKDIACDKVLVSVGRRPFTDNLGCEAAGVELDERRRIKTNDHFETSAPGIYAIGDVREGPMLAHKAEEEGVAWAEMVAGKGGHVNYEAIPSVVYTWPEAASVGLTEKQAREKFGDEIRVGKFPILANGRAKALGEKEGFVKVVAGPRDVLLGVHILAPNASEMIGEATTVLEFGGTSEDIARTCHAHPTVSESLKEAALAADGRVIHS
jgi:dihydrolipoamide dehydrogenase